MAVPFPYGLALMSGDRLLVRPDAHHGEDGSEDLVAVAVHPGLDVVDEAGPQVEPVAPAVERMLAPVDHDRRALGGGRLEVRRDPVPMLPRDQRTHLRGRIVTGSHCHLGEPVADRLHERVRDVAHGHDRRDRHAALARRAISRGDRRVGGHVDVGVGQDEHVVLRAAERLDAFAVPGRGLVDVPGDRRAPDEADRRDIRVLQEAVDGHLVALDDREDAGRDAGLGEQLGEEDRGGRVLLGRLEDERVAAGDRRREHPHRDHGREVEWRDAGDHAERLADLVDVDARRRLLAEAALDEVRDAARELEVLEAAGDLAERIRRDLAVLRGEERRELLPVRLDEVPHPEQDVRAPGERRGPPRGECRLRGRHPGVDLLDRGEVDGPGDDAAGRIVDRSRAARCSDDRLSADPVADPLQRGRRTGGGLGDLRHRISPILRDGRRPPGGAEGENTPANPGTASGRPGPGITNPGGRAGVRWWIRLVAGKGFEPLTFGL